MVFNSLHFAIFLPLVFAIYWLLRKNLRLQNLFVVVASYIFYGWWDYRFLFLIALTSLCSWGSGLLIANGKETEGFRNEDRGLRKKGWLIANIVLNLGILAVFKYFNFFVGSFCNLFGVTNSIAIKVILPVGISFYTFQALSYSIDVYRGNIRPTKDIVAFFAYVSFFPQLVAGPIERATNLLPQFEKSREFNYDEACDGMRRILWGLFKKIVIADNCAVYVDQVWEQFSNQQSAISSSTLVLATVLFAFQIYGDFSGYSDIAIGTAKLFGINLKDNFLTPYFSRNVAEFWKRWHISLNTWFVDYVYLPLGGDGRQLAGKNEEIRGKSWIKIRNTFVIFLLSGLWHGANWTYVGWGLYHALLFVPLILLGRTKAYKESATWKQLPQMLLTFVLVSIGWIIFRANSIDAAVLYISSLFNRSLFTIPWLVNKFVYIPLMLNLTLMVLVEWAIKEDGPQKIVWVIKGKPIRWGLYLLLCADIFLFGSFENVQFIYFQF